MDCKNKQYILIFCVSILIGIILILLFMCLRKTENYSNNLEYKNELDSYEKYDVLEKGRRGILKKEGEKTIPKTVRFKEFDLVKSSDYTPESPWFQAESINKYDPKFVDVFKTYF